MCAPLRTFLIFELISQVISYCSEEWLFIRHKDKLNRRREQFLVKFGLSLMDGNALDSLHGVCGCVGVYPTPLNSSLALIFNFKS